MKLEAEATAFRDIQKGACLGQSHHHALRNCCRGAERTRAAQRSTRQRLLVRSARTSSAKTTWSSRHDLSSSRRTLRSPAAAALGVCTCCALRARAAVASMLTWHLFFDASRSWSAWSQTRGSSSSSARCLCARTWLRPAPTSQNAWSTSPARGARPWPRRSAAARHRGAAGGRVVATRAATYDAHARRNRSERLAASLKTLEAKMTEKQREVRPCHSHARLTARLLRRAATARSLPRCFPPHALEHARLAPHALRESCCAPQIVDLQRKMQAAEAAAAPPPQAVS